MSLVKAMLGRGYVPQDIQAYFSRPQRSINHARISEIRDGIKHQSVKPANDDELDQFLEAWPNLDLNTGLHYRGDELLIKGREAMIAAVQVFNGAGLHFRAELFIVTAIIAWTYLLHAHYRRKGIDYRYRKGGVVERTPAGAEKYWELSQCIANGECPLERGVVNNLKFLIGIRNEIEHRSTDRIDEDIGAKLQACCINFNDSLKTLFGPRYGLEKQLPLALQFVTFDGQQRQSLRTSRLPGHIATSMEDFHDSLSEEEQRDPKFRYRVAFVPIVAGKPSKSDVAIEFIRPGSEEAIAIERVLLKDVEKPKFLPSQIVSRVRSSGFSDFSIHAHTALARELDARNVAKGYGVQVAKTWYWYDCWFDKVMITLRSGWKVPKKAVLSSSSSHGKN